MVYLIAAVILLLVGLVYLYWLDRRNLDRWLEEWDEATRLNWPDDLDLGDDDE